MIRILYATSIRYPSMLANPEQIVATAAALNGAGAHCTLGLSRLTAPLSFPHEVMGGSRRSFILAWRYVRFARRGGFTHIYCREDRLMFLMMLYGRLVGFAPKFFFEAHKIHKGFMFCSFLRKVGIIVITEGLRQDLIKLGARADAMVVVPDAVDLARFANLPPKEEARRELGLPLNKKLIGYAGSFGALNPWKGVDILLLSAQYAKPEWLYVLMGGREEELAELRRKALPNVRFEGYIPPQRIPHYLAAMDALVLPNKAGDRMSERHTSPLKLFEYMASGTPFLASDLPSIREIVGPQECVLVKANDPKALATGIEDIFSDPFGARTRAARAAQRVKGYTWESRGKAILAFIAPEGYY